MSSLSISFKNVNQGDSIFIKWTDDSGNNKYGIVDCNKENGNPIIQEIRKESCKEIEFIVISHPHEDHFSGFVELYDYLKTASISINNIFLSFDAPIVKAYSNEGTGKKVSLYNFFETLFADKKDRFPIIKKWRRADWDVTLNLEKDIFLEFKSPDPADIALFSRSLGKGVSFDYNGYSTVVEIRIKEKSILLTSDAPKNVFTKLKEYYKSKESLFYLVQVPHHGSKNNHQYKFWENLRRIEKCPAVFSVGINEHDQLPDDSVVKDFVDLDYEVNSTNPVYGIATNFGLSKLKSPEVILDFVSTPLGSLSVAINNFSGDKYFHF